MGFMNILFKDDPFTDNKNPVIEKKTTEEIKIVSEYVPPKPIITEASTPVIYSGGLNQKLYDSIHTEVFSPLSSFSKFICLWYSSTDFSQ